MTNKETADELRKKAQELLAMADKISPQVQTPSQSPEAKGDAPAQPARKSPDALSKHIQARDELLKSKQLKRR
jgi:hypothetical protein